MRKLLILAAMAAMIVACEKYSNDIPESNGIFWDGERIVAIGSTFWGGSVADPEEGASHRSHMFNRYFPSCPGWDEVESTVTITGFKYTGTTYSAPGQYLERIIFTKDIWNMDKPLDIPLEQGKYKGGCKEVSSVKISGYDYGTMKDQITGEKNDDGIVDISITLTDGHTLRIYYRGVILLDNCF